MENMIKQVIIMRTDIRISKGEMIAQGAHASMKVFFDRMTDMGYEWNIKGAYSTDFTNAMTEWMKNSFTKIVVGCNSEQELFDLQKQAEEADIVNALILDNIQTEFKQKCPSCYGKGIILKDDSSGHWDCNKCNGTGKEIVKVNKSTYTCLAIGPDESEKIDKIIGQLKLL